MNLYRRSRKVREDHLALERADLGHSDVASTVARTVPGKHVPPALYNNRHC